MLSSENVLRKEGRKKERNKDWILGLTGFFLGKYFLGKTCIHPLQYWGFSSQDSSMFSFVVPYCFKRKVFFV